MFVKITHCLIQVKENDKRDYPINYIQPVPSSKPIYLVNSYFNKQYNKNKNVKMNDENGIADIIEFLLILLFAGFPDHNYGNMANNSSSAIKTVGFFTMRQMRHERLYSFDNFRLKITNKKGNED